MEKYKIISEERNKTIITRYYKINWQTPLPLDEVPENIREAGQENLWEMLSTRATRLEKVA
jgi:hypothetical protein